MLAHSGTVGELDNVALTDAHLGWLSGPHLAQGTDTIPLTDGHLAHRTVRPHGRSPDTEPDLDDHPT